MSQLKDRIAQFRKMATDDPTNDLGHYRLGQLLSDDGQFDEAVKSFQATLELRPDFSKAYQLMAECQIKLNDTPRAIETLTKGYTVADERGDKLPRDAMGIMLGKLGAPVPQTEGPKEEDLVDGPGGFPCQRPTCTFGKRAAPIITPPMPGPLGERIKGSVCMGCWNGWLKDYSVKVVNELRLDLSSESGQSEYDKHMFDYLGFEELGHASPVPA